MPITIDELAEDRAHVQMLWGSHDVNITYRPGLITQEVFAQMSAMQRVTEDTALRQFAAFNKLFCQIIVSWDVLERDGSMFPLESECLVKLDVRFLGKVIGTVLADLRPDPDPEAVAP